MQLKVVCCTCVTAKKERTERSSNRIKAQSVQAVKAAVWMLLLQSWERKQLRKIHFFQMVRFSHDPSHLPPLTISSLSGIDLEVVHQILSYLPLAHIDPNIIPSYFLKCSASRALYPYAKSFHRRLESQASSNFLYFNDLRTSRALIDIYLDTDDFEEAQNIWKNSRESAFVKIREDGFTKIIID